MESKMDASQEKVNATAAGKKKKELETCNDATKIPNLKREGGQLPGVRELLLHGAGGEDDGKPKTWWQTLKEPLLLAAVFAISLFIFHHTVLTRPRRVAPFTLPQYKPGFQNNFGGEN